MERYEAIKAAKEEITALEGGKRKSTVVCRECGAKISNEMTYYGVCGSCLEEAN